uniref:Uncharacterized protein n=1 Tax=Arundo donax TaxID=35708 RepID=A0A0A9AKM1_ARUDO
MLNDANRQKKLWISSVHSLSFLFRFDLLTFG